MEKNVVKINEKDLKRIVSESVSRILLREAFRSDRLRDFFARHGGVDNSYRQFSLGDLEDSQIGYIQEFKTHNEAIRALFSLKKASGWKRSDYDMKYVFELFKAKDGATLLVGIKRDSVKTGVTWSGEHIKKVSDRLMNNGWSHKIRDNKYVDDSDTYYYQSPANDFGVHDSDDFKSKLQYNDKVLKSYPEGEREKYRQDKINNLRDYLSWYYPDVLKKLRKHN